MKKTYLEIYRSSMWMNKFRLYPIIIDGKKFGKIKNNERLRFEISPGNHSIRTGVGFIRSNLLNFDLAKGQRLTLTIDRKYIPFWKKLLNLLIFSTLITLGSFFGIIGMGIGSGVGSFFLVEVIAKPHIYNS